MATFPNELIPDVPHFDFDIPDGWSVFHPEYHLFGLIDRRQEGFSPNVVVRWDRRDAGFTVKQAHAELMRYVDSLGDGKVIADDQGRNHDGEDWAVAEYVYTHQRIGRLAGVAASRLVDRGGVVDVVTFIATATGPTTMDDLKRIHAIIESVTVR